MKQLTAYFKIKQRFSSLSIEGRRKTLSFRIRNALEIFFSSLKNMSENILDPKLREIISLVNSQEHIFN